MIKLRFSCDLYTPEAVSSACSAFADHASIQRSSSDNTEWVELSVDDNQEEAVVAGEFANYVLGATVDAHLRRSSP